MLPVFRVFSAASLGIGIFGLGVLGLGGFSGPALAQTQDVVLPHFEDWHHDWTPMTFPGQIGDFQRENIHQFEENQTNISSRYYDPRTRTILSIYIYRPAIPSAAIWFDRALIPIGAAETYGAVDFDGMKIGTFAPPGSTIESGQYAVLSVDGNFRSTALSMFRSGDWLVKLRISSQELAVNAMTRLLHEVQSGLPVMENLDTAPAYFIEECDTPLAFSQALAFNDPNGDPALALEASALAMMGNLAREAAPYIEAGQSQYCREGARAEEYNVYRAGGDDNSYEVAIGDAGRGYRVFPEKLYGAEPGGQSGVMVHRVQSANGLETTIHRPFIGLPTIRQSADAVYREPALARVGRRLGDENVAVTLLVSPEGEAE